MNEQILDEQVLTEDTASVEASTEIITEGEEQTTAAEDTAQDSENELELLREQVKSLTRELSERDARSERIASELGEFYELFPNTDIKALPDEVWDSVRSGTSLAASLALYNHRVSAREAKAREINSRNSALSTGQMGASGNSQYFSPDEVRAMSRSEVRANYSKILESMKWN